MPAFVRAQLLSYDAETRTGPPTGDRKPGIVADRIKRVLVAQTSAGRIAVWSGPTSRNRELFGNFCWRSGFVDDAGRYLQPLGMDACDSPKAPPLYAFVAATRRTVVAPGKHEQPGRYLGYAIGHTPERVTSVRLDFDNGRHRDATVSNEFFFGEIPCGWELERLVGLNREGETVARLDEELDGDPSDNIGPPPSCA